jgi:methylthioribose-1-phosphate isomerase
VPVHLRAGAGTLGGVSTPPPGFAVRRSGEAVHALDQRALPAQERWLQLRTADAVAEAIRTLAVRGAPLIGIAAAYGAALEIGRDAAWEDAVARLRVARPTAVNLAWAVDRVVAAARAGGAAAAEEEARAIQAEEDAASAAIARLGADRLEAAGARRLLTHCNTGALATGGTGSALACAFELARRHPGEVHVLACETRPLLQGARLTVWELARAGVPHALCADGAAAGLLARGELDAVIVGTDRVAANGDVANKVGTYAHALAARAADRPFLVAGPTSSIDGALPTGAEIEIEERDADEVRHAGGALLTLPDTPVRNPAFDVTPAALVTALVTERGVAEPVDGAAIAALLAR